jgi:hypothetical protein
MSTTVTIDGPLGPFDVPTTDHPRTREVCEHLSRQVFEGEYGHPELPTKAKADFVVLDLGGGWGAFSVWAMARWPGCSLRIYEPHQQALDVAMRNVSSAYDVARTRFHFYPEDVVISFHNRAVTVLPEPRLNGCEDWGAYALDKGGGGWPVPGIHPRDLPPCDVLKADIEGAEVELLEHYPHLDVCKAVLVEFHGPARRTQVHVLLSEAGFRCVKQPGGDADYGPMVWVRR